MNVLEWAVSSVLGSPNAQAGAIDVVAVRKPDGSLSCSPFHVKLGKASKSGEKRVVKLKVNGKEVDLSMKLGPAGEAFFVQRSRDFHNRDPTGSFPSSPRINTEEIVSPREENVSPSVRVDISNDDKVSCTEHSPLITAADSELKIVSALDPSMILKESIGPTPPPEMQVLEQVQGQRESSFVKNQRVRSLSESAALLPGSQLSSSLHTTSEISGTSTGTSSDSAVSTTQLATDVVSNTVKEAIDASHTSTTTTGTSTAVPALVLPHSRLPPSDCTPPDHTLLPDTTAPSSTVPTEDPSPSSWIWRWGALPKKAGKLNKSTADLEGLHTHHQTKQHIQRQTPGHVEESCNGGVSDSIGGDGGGVSGAHTDVSNSGSDAGMNMSGTGLRKLNSRDRAVSLPLLMQLDHNQQQRQDQRPVVEGQLIRKESGDGGSSRQFYHHSNRPPSSHHHHAPHKHHREHPSSATSSFTQQVTAVEQYIPGLEPNTVNDDINTNPTELSLPPLLPFPIQRQDTTAVDFASLFEFARKDDTKFRALSLCGHLLCSSGSGDGHGTIIMSAEKVDGVVHDAQYPASEAELRAVLEAHLITPHDIVEVESMVVNSNDDSESSHVGDSGSNRIESTATHDATPNITSGTALYPNILTNPALVVILDDFLLPIRAAERLLYNMCSDRSSDTHESHFPHEDIHLSIAQVAAVLAELNAELNAQTNSVDSEGNVHGKDMVGRENGGCSGVVDKGVPPLPLPLLLPDWAGKRISTWGSTSEVEAEEVHATAASTTTASTVTTNCAFSVANTANTINDTTTPTISHTSTNDALHHTDVTTTTTATTTTAHPPLGPLRWQQSFSDLVQAYRVQHIHTMHSYMNLHHHITTDTTTTTNTSTTTCTRNSTNATTPGLHDPHSKHTLSYKELWTRQQAQYAIGKNASFTSLLTMDAGTIHSMYASEQELDRWAIGRSCSRSNSQDAHDAQHGYDQDADMSLLSHYIHTDVPDDAPHHSHSALNDSQHSEYGVGYSFHSDQLSQAGSSHHSLPLLEVMESIEESGSGGSSGGSGGSGAGGVDMNTITDDNDVNRDITAHKPTASHVHDASLRSLNSTHTTHATHTTTFPYTTHTTTYSSTTYTTYTTEEASLPDTTNTDGDTDNDNVSLQDIEYEDISPEPAGGDFYDSDTDSYLSLSLEEGESGKYQYSAIANSSGNTDNANHNPSYNPNLITNVNPSNPVRRRVKRYLYRKVLVPSQEQLSTLDLQDGPNEIEFYLDGCAPLKSTLFVWPSDCRIVVTDIEGVFSKSVTNKSSSGVWIQFLGGGSYYSSNNQTSKTEYDDVIRLFRALHRQGYRIIYIAHTPHTTPLSSPLLSSQEYLHSIKTSTGESLPPGPIFKSPDSLVRAFGAARTDVFKAGALKGVKSLFPLSHNPYHACFCVKESDSLPFARFGFPEGRIFLVGEKGELKSANRTSRFSFPRLLEWLHEIFPYVQDSQHNVGISSKEHAHYPSVASSAHNSAKTGEVEVRSSLLVDTTSSPYYDSNDTIHNSSATLNRAALGAGARGALSAVSPAPECSPALSPINTSIASPVNMHTAPSASHASVNTDTVMDSAGTTCHSTYGVFSPTATTTATATTTTTTSTTITTPKSIPFSRLSSGAEDSYNDFNFWKIPPQIIEDEYS